VKTPGEQMIGRETELLAIHHPDTEEMEAYERLLVDAMKGNAAQFVREDYVEEAWRIVDLVIRSATPVYQYEPGTWGPKEADRILENGAWHNPTVTTAYAEMR
jgi:glucose-6-phosphate 1-dehydrogenase